MVQITIESSAKKTRLAPELPYTLSIPDPSATTIEDVKKRIYLKFPKFPVERQRLTLPGASNDGGAKSKGRAPKDEDTLENAGLDLGGTLYLKDLGPQASWTTVFLIEYAGPLIIHILVYYFFPWDIPVRKSKMQTLAFAMFILHFLKREIETLYVHRFSHSTMPLVYIFRNSAHYWIFGGLMSAVSIYGPWNSLLRTQFTIRDENWFLGTCAVLWLACEAANLSTHLTLRDLRPPGSRARAIPRGTLFNTVSFPNYTTEILGWVVVCVMTGDVCCIIYTLISAATMAKWALAKHAKYRKEFGSDYPKERKAIFPFIL